jgi:hypothetical protein
MENHVNPSGSPSKGGWLCMLKSLLPTDDESPFIPPFSLTGWIFFLAGLIPALIVGWILFPMALYSKQPQPVNFSHLAHMNPDVIEGDTQLEQCLYCHGFRDDGTFTGIPGLEKCMECHDDPESPLGEDPEEAKFLAQYVAEEQEIPWLSYYNQPDCVYFSHIAHVKMGNQDCGICHGDHGRSHELPVYEENRLTGYSRNIWGRNIAGYKVNTWDRMKMDDCAACHTEKGHPENNACFVCHK